jgi:hypothetical protein
MVVGCLELPGMSLKSLSGNLSEEEKASNLRTIDDREAGLMMDEALEEARSLRI